MSTCRREGDALPAVFAGRGGFLVAMLRRGGKTDREIRPFSN